MKNYLIDHDPTLKTTAIFMLCVWVLIIFSVFKYVPSHPVKLNPVGGYELNGYMWHSDYAGGQIR